MNLPVNTTNTHTIHGCGHSVNVVSECLFGCQVFPTLIHVRVSQKTSIFIDERLYMYLNSGCRWSMAVHTHTHTPYTPRIADRG